MNEQYTHIDLFSGIGGFALAARWTGFQTVVFCERDEWCQRVLAKNFGAVVENTVQSRPSSERGKICIGTKKSPSNPTRSPSTRTPIIPDIHDFDGTQYRGATLLTGGFPCQPFSCAGKRQGKADDRFLWPEMVRVIAEARPTWVIGENVRGIVTMELDRVLSDLGGIGYTCWPVIIPACAVDAKHRRDRVWIVANSNTQRLSKPTCPGFRIIPGQVNAFKGRESVRRNATQRGNWSAEPDVGRVAHGIPNRVDRLKGLGNAIVPQVAAELMRMIMDIERRERVVAGK